MKLRHIRFTVFCFSLLLLVSCTSGPASASRATRPSTPAPGQTIAQPAQPISAADPRFRYEGRFDFSDTNAPVVVWQASRIGLDFEGDTLGLLFDDAKGQCFFNAQVDGSNTVVEVREAKPANPATLSGLGSGRHHLVLFKRSEASAGTVRFRGVEIVADAQAWEPKRPAFKITMEFIGDSITAGACNEDGAADQWDNRRTHNAALSYAALTAAAFSADHRNIAVSGMGIATGWVEPKAGEVWDRVYPNPSSPRADLTTWTPQIVFVNFGENDDSYPRAHGQLFPAGFTDGYVALVRAVRTAYPAARIVLLRGGMFGGAQSEPLRQAWETAIAQLEGADKAISHFVFTHWTRNHPRVADHRAMADELIAWLKQQEFMHADRSATSGKAGGSKKAELASVRILALERHTPALSPREARAGRELERGVSQKSVASSPRPSPPLRGGEGVDHRVTIITYRWPLTELSNFAGPPAEPEAFRKN